MRAADLPDSADSRSHGGPPNSPHKSNQTKTQKTDESSDSANSESAPVRDWPRRADDEFGLQRFLDAQARCYSEVEQEMRAGRKRTHWIWFIFPQILIKDAWVSPAHRRYAIRSLAEAEAYLGHSVLGQRLRSLTAIVLRHTDKRIEDIMGTTLDATKFQSSMKLFSLVDSEGSVFQRALDKFFDGDKCRITIDRMRPGAEPRKGKKAASCQAASRRAPVAGACRGGGLRSDCCSLL
jgi:uncharacterized protein (DUF1810 family)